MPTKTPLPVAIDYYNDAGRLLHKFRGTLTSLSFITVAITLNRPAKATRVTLGVDLPASGVTP